MAAQGWSNFKDFWAKHPSPFTSWTLLAHLFQASKSKKHLNQLCLADLVSFRISYFTKPCYALCRFCNADCFELYIIENGCILRKLCCLKDPCVNVFVLWSLLLAWFHEIGCCNIDEHCVLVRMLVSICISGKNFESSFVEKMKLHCSLEP